MDGDLAIQALSQIVFVSIFLLTLGAFLRHPERGRLEIAALFGSLAVIIVVQGFTQLTGIKIPLAALIGGLVLLAQPYLLLRLVAHFRRLPVVQQLIGLAYVAGSWAILI